MSEPKHPSWANPTSSSTTSSTLGAPARARTGSGHHGSASWWYRPIVPPNSPDSILGSCHANPHRPAATPSGTPTPMRDQSGNSGRKGLLQH